MATDTSPPPLPPSHRPVASEHGDFVDEHLARVRNGIRVSDFFGKTMGLAAVVLIYLLGLIVLDHWVVELGTVGRVLGLAGLIFGSGFYVVRFLLPDLLRKINPAYAAQMVERTEPSLRNSLINFVMLRPKRGSVREVIYQQVEEQAASRLARVDVADSVDQSPLIRLALGLLAAMILFAGYTIFSPKSPFQSIARIVSPFAEISRPARVRIGDIQPRNATVFAGDTVEVSAIVDLDDEAEPVWLVFSTTDGQQVDVRRPMRRNPISLRHVATPTEDGIVLQTMDYRIIAGDAEEGPFRITVSQAPTIFVEQVLLDYPRYTGMAAESLDHQADVRALEGTRVTIRARANQIIDSARIEFDAGDGSQKMTRLKMTSDGRTAEGSFVLKLREDRVTPSHAAYQLRFTSADGKTSQNPVRHTIEVLPDLPPQVEILTPAQRRIEVPQNAQQVIEIRGLDPDFGLSDLRLQAAQIGQGGRKIIDHSLLDEPGMGQRVAEFVFRPREYELQSGDEVVYRAVARDNRVDSDSGSLQPNASATERYTIVITPPREVAPNDKEGLGPDDGQEGQPDPGGEPEKGAEGANGEDGEGADGESAGGEGAGGEGAGGESADGEASDDEGAGEGAGQQGKGEEGAEGQQGEGAKGLQGAEGQEGQQGDMKDGEGAEGEGAEGEGAEGRPQEGPAEQGEGTAGEPADGAEGKPNAEGGAPTASAKGSQKGEQGEKDGEAADPGEAGEEAGEPLDSDGSEDGEAFERILDRMKEKFGEQSDGTPKACPNGECQDSDGESGSSDASSEGKDGEGKDGEGKDGAGKDGAGKDGEGKDGEGKDGEGKDGEGKDGEGKDGAGKDGEGKDGEGKDGEGKDGEGKDGEGKDGEGKDGEGKDGEGKDGEGKDGAGKDGAGMDGEGKDSAGKDSAGKDGEGKDGEGKDGEGKDGAGKDGEGKDGAGKDGEGKDGEGKDGEGKDGEGKDGEGKDGEGKDGEGKDGEGKDGEGKDGEGKDGAGKDGAPRDPQDPTGEPNDSSANSPSGDSERGAMGPESSDGNSEWFDDEELPEPGGDDPNLEYARKATDLALDYLKHNQDEELQDDLGWSNAEMQRFAKRWQELQEQSSISESAESERELNEALRSLGLRNGNDQLRRGVTESDDIRVRDSGTRSQPPAEYIEQYRAYLKSLGKRPRE